MSILVQVPSSGRNHKAVAGRAIKRRSSESESGKRCPWILRRCNYSAPQTRQAPRSSACFKGVLWSNKGTLFPTKKPVDMTKIVVKIIRLRLANGRQCNLELLATHYHYHYCSNHHVIRALVVETCREGINQILCQNCHYCQKRSGNLKKHI